MSKLKDITIDGEKFFYSISFDIDDVIGDGIWWLQIYDDNLTLIYDRQFASSMYKINERKMIEIIQNEFVTYQGAVL